MFEPQDSEMLAQFMRKLIDDPQLIVSMGEKSKQIMSVYTPKSASETLVEIVKSLRET